MIAPAPLQGIVFDLDGTLYSNEPFSASLQAAAVDYIAALKGIGTSEAAQLMAATRQRLYLEQKREQPLSVVCTELDGTIELLHRHFQETLQPEAFLQRDDRVITLLQLLAQKYSLYIYTNNNRVLTTRIIRQLGLEALFCRIITIDESWRGKPDLQMLLNFFDQTGLIPGQTLFVGDRYDIDLRLPEQLGCPVLLCQSVEQLLTLEQMLLRL
ncbi:MAG TPA: HAD family hydrolase [Desulfuromonadales bacterium]|nr:HAD family hydrolase [Desulfuromonadales bacterium]